MLNGDDDARIVPYDADVAVLDNMASNLLLYRMDHMQYIDQHDVILRLLMQILPVPMQTPNRYRIQLISESLAGHVVVVVNAVVAYFRR